MFLGEPDRLTSLLAGTIECSQPYKDCRVSLECGHFEDFLPSFLAFCLLFAFNLTFIFSFQPGLKTGCLLRFAIGDGGLTIVDGKLERADLHYLGMSNRARAFADTYSKVYAQFTIAGTINSFLVLNVTLFRY